MQRNSINGCSNSSSDSESELPNISRASSMPIEQEDAVLRSLNRAVSVDDFLASSRTDQRSKKNRTAVNFMAPNKDTRNNQENLAANFRNMGINHPRSIPDIPITGKDGMQPDERPRTPPARSISVIPFDHESSTSSSISRPRVVRSCLFWNNRFNNQSTSSSSVSSLELDEVKPNKIRKPN